MFLADVVAHMADVIITCSCCSDKFMADVVAMWQMEKPLCLCVCAAAVVAQL